MDGHEQICGELAGAAARFLAVAFRAGGAVAAADQISTCVPNSITRFDGSLK
jgi:hypothetical protein